MARHVRLRLPLLAFADTGGDLLVHVRDVLDVTHVVTPVVEPPVEHVGVEPQPRVPEVGVVRDRQPTDVQQDLRRLDWNAFLPQGVGHGQ